MAEKNEPNGINEWCRNPQRVKEVIRRFHIWSLKHINGALMMKQGNGEKKILKKLKKIWVFKTFQLYLHLKKR